MNFLCLKNNGLAMFTATADQRMLLGRELFLRTHFPMKFKRFRSESAVEVWDETNILNYITNKNQDKVGNNVIVLFGAAGSGKSEIIRWLETQLQLINFQGKAIRISRSELDPVYILKKILSQTSTCLDFKEEVLIKWEALKRKPVALANSIVWNALSSMLEDDENIIPISYKMRHVIETNLRRNFAGVLSQEELSNKGLEILSLEEFEDIVDTSPLPINIEYEQLRKQLIEKLETEILGGYSFVKTIKEIGNSLYQSTGYRPVLFIDDLVQSMNVYASDLLDFFITLEEGNWEIVIGVTPASFESTKRGQELLNRITQLDTFDDRILKLWLTDEFGQESYFISEENASDYISIYLNEYKKTNGFACGENCTNFQKCSLLHWGKNEDVMLTPLNKPLIKRLYRNLQKGKGHPRHFVIMVGEYLKALLDGEDQVYLEKHVKRDVYIEMNDCSQRVLIESLFPEVTGRFFLPQELMDLFGFGKKEMWVNVLNLKNKKVSLQINTSPSVSSDDLSVVRDWLEDKPVNKELMKPIRIGVGRFLKEFGGKIGVVRPYTSRLMGIIRREQTVDGSTIPISFESVDNYDGIIIRKSIGSTVFSLVTLQNISKEELQNEINVLISNDEISFVLKQYTQYSERVICEFRQDVSVDCDELAFLLYVFLFYLAPIEKAPLILKKYYSSQGLCQFPGEWGKELAVLSEEEKIFIVDYFKDWFQLRENLFDGYKILNFINLYPDIVLILQKIMMLTPARLSDCFKLTGNTVKKLLISVTTIAQKYFRILVDEEFRRYCRYQLNIFEKFRNLSLEELRNFNEDFDLVRGSLNEEQLIRGYEELVLIEEQLLKKSPNNVWLISKVANSILNSWYVNLQKRLDDSRNECEDLRQVFIKKTAFLFGTTGYIDQLIEERSGVLEPKELVSSLNYTLYTLKLLQKKLMIIGQFGDSLSAKKIDELRDYTVFFEYVCGFLNYKEKIGSKALQYYQHVKQLIQQIEEFWCNIEEVGDFDLINLRKLFADCTCQKIKNEVIEVLIRIISSFEKLNFFEVRNTKDGAKLIVNLQKILKGNKNYTSLNVQLQKYSKYMEEILLKIRNNSNLEQKTKEFVIAMLENQSLSQRLDSVRWEIYEELQNKIPELTKTIVCTYKFI